MSHTATRSHLGWYLDRIKHTPLLTAQQERQLARRIREHSDPVAREQMIQANLRLVVKIAKDYSNPGMTLGDLVAEGNLGLVRAVEEFDPAAGVRFSTYASWWIKQSIKRAMINAGQPIHIPAYMAKMIRKWKRTWRDLENSLGRTPTLPEMATSLGLSKKKAEIVQQGLTAVNVAGPFGDDEGQALAEMIADERIDSPDKGLLDGSNRPLVVGLLEQLEPREQVILTRRFGLDGVERSDDERTYKSIGRQVGLTRERVRQLEKKALAQLRELAEQIL